MSAKPVPVDLPLPAAVAASANAANDEAAPVAQAQFRLGGLVCAACAETIRDALTRVDGVLEVSVNAAGECAAVRFDPRVTDTAACIEAVERAGYVAVPDTAAAARTLRRAESRRLLWRWFVAAFCAMQVMMFATPAYVSEPGELPADLASLLQRAVWMLTLPVIAFSASPFFRGAWRTLRRGRLGMDVPVALGIGAAFVAGTAATFDPTGPFASASYLDSLAMFVAFLLGGRWLEMRLRHRAEEALEASCERLPESVLRVDPDTRDGIAHEVPIASLRAGDLILVPPGQAFAADGVVVEGESAADEALLTGESVPCTKGPGDAVAAGSLNVSGPLRVRVERTGADTRYEAIVSLMRAARARRPALLARADRFAVPFLAGVLLLAVAAAAVWSVIDPSRTLGVFVAVLVVTCPCALSLAAPTALLAAAGAMGRRGLLPRRLEAIERLADMELLYVDKTGTLTEGRLDVRDVCMLPDAAALGVDETALRGMAVALALGSAHPASRAVAALEAAGPLPLLCARREVAGQGAEALDNEGHRWRLGRPAWAVDVVVPLDDEGATLLSLDGRPCLRIELGEQVRDDAFDAVRALQADGVRVHLLTGDAAVRACRVSEALGLDGTDSGLTPEGKLAILEAAQSGGARVAMLGDGINDAPVLARASLAIAMGAGAAVARTQADAVLVSDRLSDLAAARALARRALRVVRQNLAWAALYNAACVPLALTGHLPPWLAGAGMAASSLVVVANSMRLTRA